MCVVVTAKRTSIVRVRRTGPAGMRVGAKGGRDVWCLDDLRGQWVYRPTHRSGSDAARADAYRAYACTILRTLCTEEFLAIETPGWEGILKHGIYHERRGLGVDESVTWGDYFFLEALDRLLGDQASTS